jgi:hypothetical protein
MFTISPIRLTRPVAIVAALTLAVLLLAATPAAHGTTGSPDPVLPSVSAEQATSQIEAKDGVLRFDVAEDGSRFNWSGDPELRDGMPVGSTPYVAQGYIYPEGTLTDTNGVLEDGSPEFPDKVLGQWSCWGWRLAPSAHADTAPWLTTHLFNFGSGWGEATVVSEGYSVDDLGVALERAISGGTGEYAGASGVQLETNLGFNASRGGNFRFELRLDTQ